jgi:arginase
MPVALIVVPFHMGLEDSAVGAGPNKLLDAGADVALGYRGRPAQVEHIRLRDAECSGIDAVVDVGRQIRMSVRQAREQEMLPVILAGNCISCVPILAGLEPAATGIVWLDAHPDFHTPETSVSGNLDGMSLSMAVGHCHEDLLGRIGFGRPVATNRVCLLGVRDIEPGERERLAEHSIAAEPPADVEAVYLHIDLDVLDPSESPGVNCRRPGGWTLEETCAAVRSVAAELPLAAVALTNYRPDFDPDGKSGRAALRILSELQAMKRSL